MNNQFNRIRRSLFVILLAITHINIASYDNQDRTLSPIFAPMHDINEFTILDAHIQRATLNTYIEKTRSAIASLTNKAQKMNNKKTDLLAEETDPSKCDAISRSNRSKLIQQLSDNIVMYHKEIQEKQNICEQAEADRDVLDAIIKKYEHDTNAKQDNTSLPIQAKSSGLLSFLS